MGIVATALVFYFLPTVIALLRGKKNSGAVRQAKLIGANRLKYLYNQDRSWSVDIESCSPSGDVRVEA
jgi:hypothetical protein